MRVAIFGAGLVGRRTAVSLAAIDGYDVVLVAQTRTPPPVDGVDTVVGWPNPASADADVVVLATESAHQFAVAREVLRSGTHVISTADDPGQIERMWELDDLARTHDVALIVGAAYSPGVSTALASYLVRQFDDVSTISTAQFGTGGPACAREHHRAMSAPGREVHRGLLRQTRGGTGRELVWFPDPIGAADCYRAALADPFLLHQAFPAVRRIESRQAATRRDRLTARLPMLRPPHPEGLLGAVWVEVRGTRAGRVEHRAMAASGAQATGAAAMTTAFCTMLAEQHSRERAERDAQHAGERTAGETGERAERDAQHVPVGVLSAASMPAPSLLLRHVSKDLRLWAYDGSQIVVSDPISGVRAARKWKISPEIG